MKRFTVSSHRFSAFLTFSALSASLALAQNVPSARPPAEGQAQDQQQPDSNRGGWRRVTDPPPAQPSPAPQAEAAPPADARDPGQAPAAPQGPNAAYPAPPSNGGYRPADAYGQTGGPTGPTQSGRPEYQGYQPMPVIPAQLILRSGTYLTVRIDQPLSSDRNHPGDAFSATLVKPLVIDGVVVAERGQTLGGRVVEAQKAGRVEGVARLAVELVDVPLADGQQLPIKSQLVARTGGTSQGRDAGAIASTTALGAATGAIADGGFGAGIGAAAGAVAGTIGVLLTRGHASIIYPESVLTFRVETPVTISTVRAPQAFHFVDPRDYQQADNAQVRYQARSTPPPAYGYYGGYYGSPYPYYPYYPYYWGSGIGFYFGPSFYGHGYYRGGFYGRGGYHGGRGFHR